MLFQKMQQLVKDILHAVDVIHKINVKNNAKMHCFYIMERVRNMYAKKMRELVLFFLLIYYTQIT